jgi:hypothetical protein
MTPDEHLRRRVSAAEPAGAERIHELRTNPRICTDDTHLELLATIARLEDAARETMEEIEYWHADMLTPDERAHPRGSGWARVYDKLKAALS